MSLPNKLTVLRVILIPVMAVLYYIDDAKTELNVWSLVIAGLFIIGSLTDYLDGYLARKHDMVTTFGQFLDPLADKLLVMFALLMLMAINIVPMWVVLVILAREFIVTGIRLVAMGEGTIVVAGSLGKYKTFITMVALTMLLLRINDTVEILGMITLYVGVLLTVVSGYEYYAKNKEAVFKTK